MKVSKEIKRTRKVVVEVEGEHMNWVAAVVDHFDTENKHVTRSGEEVSINVRAKDGCEGPPGFFIAIKDWPLVRDAVERVIKEFKAAYPESPQ